MHIFEESLFFQATYNNTTENSQTDLSFVRLLLDRVNNFHDGKRKRELVSWCFEPRQPQKITSGVERKVQSIPKLFIPQVIISQISFFSDHNSAAMHNFGTQALKNVNTCSGADSYSLGTQHGNLHPTR